MKLLPLTKNKEIWLKEFDHWVTPSLEEIRDSEIFHKTIQNIKEVIELLGAENNGFTTNDAASAKHIADAVMHGIRGKDSEKIYSLVISFSDLLFLVTGKTDNNYKCQFPVYVKEVLKWKNYPAVRGKKFKYIEVPRVIKSENISLLIVQLEVLKANTTSGTLEQLKLADTINTIEKDILFQYFTFILNQEIYLRSLKAFGAKYFELKTTGNEEDILAPIIIAYVRGSASASGGHKPESILRAHMNNWGLRPNEDYNIYDVQAFEETQQNSDKTRAYDFVLPYNVKDWSSQIFIQAQFYAGDSGSVSHKNVDQTSTSRQAVKAKVASPKFVEYVDGAGYYGSLNGDLKRLFNMSDTENFFQVRTSHIKLRQLLQGIGFLTPLELVHALAVNEFSLASAKHSLIQDGYKEIEIDRVIQKAHKEEILCLTASQDQVQINEAFYTVSRRYFLLDCFAVQGTDLVGLDSGYALVPGYGEYFGAKISELIEKVKKQAGNYYRDWQAPELFSKDLEFLLEKKWIIFNT